MSMDELFKELRSSIGELKENVVTQEELKKKLANMEAKFSDKFAAAKTPLAREIGDRDEILGFAKWLKASQEGKAGLKAAGYMAEGVEADGGYLVPEEYRPTLLRLIEQYGIIRRGATTIPMVSDTMNFPKLASGLTIAWANEGDTAADQKPQFGQLTLNAKKAIGLVPITSELLEDSALPVANLVVTLFAEAMAKEEDRVGFSGSTAAGDPFDGILYDAGVTYQSLPAGSTTFDSVTADDLADLNVAIPNSATGGAAYYMHRTVFNVVRKLKDNNGNYIYNPPAGNTPGTIWGYPVMLVDSMPAISATAVDTPFVGFGNLKYLYLGDRRRFTVAQSSHAGFASDQTFIRFTERIAIKVSLGEAFAVLKTAAV